MAPRDAVGLRERDQLANLRPLIGGTEIIPVYDEPVRERQVRERSVRPREARARVSRERVVRQRTTRVSSSRTGARRIRPVRPTASLRISPNRTKYARAMTERAIRALSLPDDEVCFTILPHGSLEGGVGDVYTGIDLDYPTFWLASERQVWLAVEEQINSDLEYLYDNIGYDCPEGAAWDVGVWIQDLEGRDVPLMATVTLSDLETAFDLALGDAGEGIMAIPLLDPNGGQHGTLPFNACNVLGHAGIWLGEVVPDVVLADSLGRDALVALQDDCEVPLTGGDYRIVSVEEHDYSLGTLIEYHIAWAG